MQKVYVPNWFEEVFGIKKIENTMPWTYVTLMVKKVLECLNKKELWKTNQTEFRTKKVIKGKSDKIYVKWKGYDN